MYDSAFATRISTQVITRKIVSGEHLNPNGSLFGGHLMSWIDEVAFVCARRFTGCPKCVTVHIDQVTFRHPIFIGEHLVLTAVINAVGRSSMELYVKVEREDAQSRALTFTNDAHLTFVCLGANGRPIRVPKLVLETDEDRLQQHEAQLRVRVRKRLGRFLANRSASRFSKPRQTNPSLWKVQFVLNGSWARLAKKIGIASGYVFHAP